MHKTKSRSARGTCPPSKERTPWIVPKIQKLELVFFQKVFQKLREDKKEDIADGDVPLVLFQRTMSRLFRFLRQEREFSCKQYDMNSDGMVSWWEFCVLWKQEQLTVEFSLAERIHLTLENPEASRLGRLTSIFVLMAIALSAGGFIFSTLPTMQYQCCETCAPKPKPIFSRIDTVCVILFTIEYMLRLGTAACMRSALTNQEDLVRDICSDEAIAWPTKLQRMWAYMRAWPNLIDLVAILPSYIDFIPTGDCPEAQGNGSSTTRAMLSIIRLMRVVRAFRLGKRLEAIVIIARSMRRSIRAVWVLILNISLGVLVFGAVIFFLEQGTYCSYFGAYIRYSDTWFLPNSENEETNINSAARLAADSDQCLSLASNGAYYEGWERSPFESIPHAFWWALVTATTVGFGDDVPTTLLGRMVAAVAMVWSLCVLALPIGVIGDNFGHVWDEYDAEKVVEKELRNSERQMSREMLATIDPLSWSKVLTLEVYHDSHMATPDNDAFLGEAECDLLLEPGCRHPVDMHLKLPLCENRSKSNRRVHGEISIRYTWTPKESSDPSVLLQGSFELTVEGVDGLVPIDWKANGLSDTYVKITTYPHSPDDDGILHPQVVRTATKPDDPHPVWNMTILTDVYWHQAGISAKILHNRRALKESLQTGRKWVRGPVKDANADLIRSLPRLESGLAEVQRSMLSLQSEVGQVRQLAKEIGEHLNIVDELSSSSRTPAPRSGGRAQSKTEVVCPTPPPGPSPTSRKLFATEDAAEVIYGYAVKREEDDHQWLLQTRASDHAAEQANARSFMMPGAIAEETPEVEFSTSHGDSQAGRNMS
mmetsp:Transcript_9154/g.20382  ORF Transcript_9154/g.20382 Transcript_9154/m.20382 type:complete len:823 (-) Transcript_9154:84-2552(-)